MYALHRLCKNSQDFVFSFNGTGRSRNDAVSFALAAVVVNSISLLKDQDQKYFVGSHKDQIVSRFNSINEMIRIDIDKIIGYAQKLYSYRCSQLNSEECPNIIYSNDNAVFDFFGLSRHFSKEDLKLIHDEGPSMASDMLKFHSLMRELGFFDAISSDVPASVPPPSDKAVSDQQPTVQ